MATSAETPLLLCYDGSGPAWRDGARGGPAPPPKCGHPDPLADNHWPSQLRLGGRDRESGDSQFWTSARRFAQLEAPVSIRRQLGRDRLADDPRADVRAAGPWMLTAGARRGEGGATR